MKKSFDAAVHRLMLLVSCIFSFLYVQATFFDHLIPRPSCYFYLEFVLLILIASLIVIVVVRNVRKSSLHQTIEQIVSPCDLPVFLLLALFLVLILVNTLIAVARGYSELSDNAGRLFCLLVGVFLFFFGYHLAYHQKEYLLRHYLMDFSSAFFAIMLLIALTGYTLQTQLIVHWQLVEGRVFFCGTNPNVTGRLLSLLIVCGAYRIASGNSAEKILYLFGESIFAVTLALVDSRANILSVGVSFGYYVGLCLFHRARDLKIGKAFSLLLSMVCGGICFLLIWFLRLPILLMPALLSVFILYVVLLSLFFVKDRIHLTRKFLTISIGIVILGVIFGVCLFGRKILSLFISSGVTVRGVFNDSTSIRLTIWKSVFLALRDNPCFLLHGAGYNGALDCIEFYCGEAFYSAHNQFLDILLAYGLPVLLVFIAWLAALVIRSTRLMNQYYGKPESAGVCLLPLILLNSVATNIFETRLLSQEADGCMFFLIAGVVCALSSRAANQS